MSPNYLLKKDHCVMCINIASMAINTLPCMVIATCTLIGRNEAGQ